MAGRDVRATGAGPAAALLRRAAAAAVLLLAAVLPSGCAGMRAECRAHGGTDWRELRTEHFRVRTQLGPAASRQAAEDLELYRAALLGTFGGGGPSGGEPVEVVLLSDGGAFRELVPPPSGGFTTQLHGRWMLVIPGDTGGNAALALPEVMRHELAHYVLRQKLLRMPRWLNEGLAGHLSTLSLTPDRSGVLLGAPPLREGQWVSTQGVLELGELWDWESRCPGARLACYASSWLWVRYLNDVHPDAFAQLQQRLGRAEEPRDAFRAAFGHLSETALTRGAAAYLEQNETRLYRMPFAPPRVAVSERPLSDAEVHVLRAQMRLVAPLSEETLPRLGGAQLPTTRRERLAAVEEEVARALALEPELVAARVLAARLAETPEEMVEGLRALVRDHPTEGEAWKALARSLGADDAGERLEALAQAHALMPHDVQVLDDLAWAQTREGRWEEALPLAERAVALAPWAPLYADTLAGALHAAGRCREALAQQRRALDLLDEHASRRERADMLQRLEDYARTCSPARPASEAAASEAAGGEAAGSEAAGGEAAVPASAAPDTARAPAG